MRHLAALTAAWPLKGLEGPPVHKKLLCSGTVPLGDCLLCLVWLVTECLRAVAGLIAAAIPTDRQWHCSLRTAHCSVPPFFFAEGN